MTPQEILAKKRSEIFLSVEDVFSEVEDPSWREKHPLGPVHVQINCRCCGQIISSDLKDFGWLNKEPFVNTQLLPHYKKHLTGPPAVVS